MKSSDYIRQLLFSIGTKLAMLALRLLRNVLLARILGPADRGLFALLSALPELIGAATVYKTPSASLIGQGTPAAPRMCSCSSACTRPTSAWRMFSCVSSRRSTLCTHCLKSSDEVRTLLIS